MVIDIFTGLERREVMEVEVQHGATTVFVYEKQWAGHSRPR